MHHFILFLFNFNNFQISNSWKCCTLRTIWKVSDTDHERKANWKCELRMFIHNSKLGSHSSKTLKIRLLMIWYSLVFLEHSVVNIYLFVLVLEHLTLFLLSGFVICFSLRQLHHLNARLYVSQSCNGLHSMSVFSSLSECLYRFYQSTPFCQWLSTCPTSCGTGSRRCGRLTSALRTLSTT